MTPTCDQSPTGQHCVHWTYVGQYTTAGPRQVCCYCGQSEVDGHGPYHPNRNHYVTYNPNNFNAAGSMPCHGYIYDEKV